ncbi:phosphatidylglycerol lysyltransferase domain-containing protein, partial [Exiguobacterium himgiriensis]
FSQTDAIFLDQDAAAFLSLSATLLAGIAMLAVFFTFSRLKRPQLGETFEASRFEAFQAAHTTAATYDLAHMGDKRVYYGEEDAACLLFASAGNHAIVFGDVQGDRQAASELLATFLEETDRFGYVPLFYQVTPDWMPRLHDAGFTFFKLGEEATVDVGSFSLAGKKRSNMRALNNQFSRNGFTFEVVSNPDQTLIEALRPISDDWLGNRKEKGFSLGFFNEVALPHYRTALLRNEAGEIVAFITLLQGTGQVSIDLMRVKQDAPAGTMEVLILYVIEWARTEAFERVGLGMAPLASVGEQPFSYWPERVAADVFENISYIYPFSGLRQFKHKFSPTWDARYLAIRKRRKLLPSLLRTARLISRKR